MLARLEDLKRAGVRIALFLALSMLASCGTSALPTSEHITTSPWSSFVAAKAAYDRVKPGTTSVQELEAQGFDPYASPNVRVLSYLDILRHFLTSDAIRIEDLDPAVQRCVEVRDACSGYHIQLERVLRKREGSTFLDLFNFERRTHETGWNFNALFVIENNRVTYKLWSGLPKIDRWTDQNNPLGPVQEPASVVRDRLP